MISAQAIDQCFQPGLPGFHGAGRRRVGRRIHPYAAESPGEFFAVMSEAFFELPQLLRGHYPQVYAQLRAFYRPGPAGRLALVRAG